MGLRGLEPPRVTPTDPKSVASANFATGPYGESTKQIEKNESNRYESNSYMTISRQDKFLSLRYMSRRPKYKRGFTFGHHFDEWWDRRGVDFQNKLYLFLLLIVVTVVGVGLYHWQKKVEEMELRDALEKKKELEPPKPKQTFRIDPAPRSTAPSPINPSED